MTDSKSNPLDVQRSSNIIIWKHGDPPADMPAFVTTKLLSEMLGMTSDETLVEAFSEALEIERFNRIYKIVNARFDVRNPTLVRLIHTCLDTPHHVLSVQVRAEFAEQVPKGVFNLIEDCCRITAPSAKV